MSMHSAVIARVTSGDLDGDPSSYDELLALASN